MQTSKEKYPQECPRASKEREWLQSDEDVDGILEATAICDVDQRLQLMSSIVIITAAERFGTKEQHRARNSSGPNRRETRLSKLRQELKSQRYQYKMAREEKRAALAQLW